MQHFMSEMDSQLTEDKLYHTLRKEVRCKLKMTNIAHWLRNEIEFLSPNTNIGFASAATIHSGCHLQHSSTSFKACNCIN